MSRVYLRNWMETFGGQESYLLPRFKVLSGYWMLMVQSALRSSVTSAPLTAVDPVPGAQ